MAAGLFGFFTTPKIDNGIEFYPDFKGISNSYICQKGSLGRKVIDKLHQDRFFETRKNISIGLEGVNLSKEIPNTNAYKKNQIIYFDWLKKYHPQVLNYPWDKINMKPTNQFKIKYGKLFKKYVNGARKYLNWNYESMNPYGTWLKQNKSIIKTLDKIVETETRKPYIDNEIAQDLKAIYKDDIFEFRNKFAVVTALYALKLHFEKP